MALPSVTYTFVAGTTIDPTQVNTNFTNVISAMTDGTRDFTINDLTLNGTLTPDASSGFGADIVPATDSTYDLGTTAKRFAETWTDALTVTDDVTVGGEMTISGTGTHSVSAEFANEVFEEYERSTGTTVGVRGVAFSTSSGALQNFTSSTFTDVTNLTVTITTTGRPVMLMLQNDGAGTGAYIFTSDSSANAFGSLRFLRDGSTEVAEYAIFGGSIGGASSTQFNNPVSMFQAVDDISAGTYTYKVQISDANSSGSTSIAFTKLVAFEL